MDAYSFYVGDLMDADSFNCDWVYNGDQDLRYRPCVDGSHGNLASSGNVNRNGSARLDPSIIYPSSYYNDVSAYHIPSVLSYPQGSVAPLLSDKYMKDRPILDRYHGNLVNHGDRDIDGS